MIQIFILFFTFLIEYRLKQKNITPPLFSIPDELITLYIAYNKGIFGFIAFSLHLWRFIFNFKKIINIPCKYHLYGVFSVLSLKSRFTLLFNSFYRIFITKLFHDSQLITPIIDMPITFGLIVYIIYNFKNLTNNIFDNFIISDLIYHIAEIWLN